MRKSDRRKMIATRPASSITLCPNSCDAMGRTLRWMFAKAALQADRESLRSGQPDAGAPINITINIERAE
jgi:hypothetical protein